MFKKLVTSVCLTFPIISVAASQCPDFSAFSQDNNNKWHLTSSPSVPEGATGWVDFSQSRNGKKFHQLNLTNVQIDTDSVPARIACAYGYQSDTGATNVFMGIDLDIQANELPKPAVGSAFINTNNPKLSVCEEKNPALCQFDIAPK